MWRYVLCVYPTYIGAQLTFPLSTGLCAHHGVLGVFRWPYAEHASRCRDFWLIHHPHHRTALRIELLHHTSRKRHWPPCAPRCDHDLRTLERIFHSEIVGILPYWVLRCHHDRERRGGGAGYLIESSGGDRYFIVGVCLVLFSVFVDIGSESQL